VYFVLGVVLGGLRVMGILVVVLKGTFNDRTGTLFHYSRLSLREWFMLILLFLGLHNSCNGLSWLLCRISMTGFKAYVEANG